MKKIDRLLIKVFPGLPARLGLKVVNGELVQIIPGLAGGGCIAVNTELVAKRKVLTDKGRIIYEAYKVAHPELTERELLDVLPKEQPELWEYDGMERRILNRVVTDDFCEDIVDNLIAEVSAFGDYKYHHSGTGVGAEAAADAGLGTPELDARTVGTQVEDSSKVYKSIATETFDATAAITEHGLFNTAGAGGPPVTGGILMDRTVFAAINVVNTNQIEWTFTIAFTSGG